MPQAPIYTVNDVTTQINTDIGKKNYNCGASQIHKKLYYDNSEGNMEYQMYNCAKKTSKTIIFHCYVLKEVLVNLL